MSNENQITPIEQEEQKEISENVTQENETAEIEPIRVVTTKDYRSEPEKFSESLILRVKTTGKNADEITVQIESSDLADKKSFKTAICTYTANLNIDLKEKEFTKLRKSWYDNADHKTIYACAGSQNGKFIWANAYHDYETRQTTYLEKTDETKGYDCMENSLVDMKNICHPLLYPAKQPPLPVLKQFFYSLCSTYPNSHVLVCFGMALATVYWDIFQKETQGFPTIFFVGEHHSGKSTLLMVLAAIFGLMNSSQITGGNSTIYAITQKLSSSMNIPVFLEEFSPEILGKLEPLIKNIYSGTSRARGKKDGIEEMKIFTSFVATSNSFFPKLSGQLLSRIVFANMKKGQFNLDNFPYFDIEKRKELSQILPIFLCFRSEIVPIYKGVYAEIEKLIPDKGRHISNLAISCSIWYLVNKLMGYELVNWRQIAVDYNAMYQSYLNSEINPVDVIMNDITRMIVLDKLNPETDWKLIHGGILRLNLNRYIEKYNVANPQTMMTSAQFRLIVSNDNRFDTKSIPMKKIGRAVSIDVSGNEHLLETLKLQQNSMERINGKIAEE